LLSVATIATPLPDQTTFVTVAVQLLPDFVEIWTLSPSLTAPWTLAPHAPERNFVGVAAIMVSSWAASARLRSPRLGVCFVLSITISRV
jgi:hypothetical protein